MKSTTCQLKKGIVSLGSSPTLKDNHRGRAYFRTLAASKLADFFGGTRWGQRNSENFPGKFMKKYVQLNID